MEKVNEADLEWKEYDHGDHFFYRKQLGKAVEGDALGCSLYILPSGKQSWPYHYHTANEEALYVLAGNGQLRGEGETIEVTPGDYVSLPADSSGGHQVINNTEDDLRYLMISTMHEPDVTIYPDSDRFGVFVDAPPGGSGKRSLEGFFDQNDEVAYWDTTES